jgi:hypothetical protein
VVEVTIREGKKRQVRRMLEAVGHRVVELEREIDPAVALELGIVPVAEPVPVMIDGSTFAVHGPTRTFWVKLWHAAGSEMTKIDRAQVISCLPSTRGVQIVVESPEED